MSRLHRLILKSFLGPMFLTFFIVMFILLMQFLWKYIDELIGKGFSSSIIAELLLYASATMIPMALPLGLLLAALMTMGNLGEHNELLALKSSGISLARIMMPMAFISIVITVLAFLAANYLVPLASWKMDTLLYSMRQKKPELIIKPGVFYHEIEGYSLRVDAVDRKTNLMQGISIYDLSKGTGAVAVTKADSGYITFTPEQSHVVMDLHHGTIYEEMAKNPNDFSNDAPLEARRVAFQRQRIVRPIEGFGFKREDEALFANVYSSLNTEELLNYSDSIQGLAQNICDQVYEALDRSNIFIAQDSGVMRFDSAARKVAMHLVYDTLPPHLQRDRIIGALDPLRSLKETITRRGDDKSYYDMRRARYMVEYHRKYALSVACFLFFLIGAPLGAIIRKGGLGLPTAISVLFFVAYYVISLTTEKFARKLVWDPASGMWFSAYVLLPIAIFLIYKATTDSSLMSAEWYRMQLQKVRAALRRGHPSKG